MTHTTHTLYLVHSMYYTQILHLIRTSIHAKWTYEHRGFIFRIIRWPKRIGKLFRTENLELKKNIYANRAAIL